MILLNSDESIGRFNNVWHTGRRTDHKVNVADFDIIIPCPSENAQTTQPENEVLDSKSDTD